MHMESVKLLRECNSGCKMAIGSMNQILGFVKNPDMKQLIEKSRKEHEKLEEETSNRLEGAEMREKEPGMIASAFSWVTTELKMKMKESDNEAAKIMMDGCNMGIQSISEKLNEWREADEESRTLAHALISEEEHLIQKLKAYL